MPRILVSDSIAPAGIEHLHAAGQVDLEPRITADALQAVIGDYDALIVRSRTKVTSEVIHAASRLRVIGRAGSGLDNVDAESAARRGIAVVNSPTSVAIAVAEHTIGMMIALSRFIPQADASLKRGEWAKNALLGVELWDKTLGIVGLGRIGGLVALRASAFGMRILAYDPYITRERAEQFHAKLIDSFDDMLARSDFVSVHTPLLPTTRGLMGRAEFAKMKPNARLIFCARGGVVDESALLEALENQTVAGAALDVFENEPPVDSPLVHHPRVVATPHLGAMTEEAQARAAVEVAEQVVAILRNA
jgi:D-3-phosphoglycerate dehydrogenase